MKLKSIKKICSCLLCLFAFSIGILNVLEVSAKDALRKNSAKDCPYLYCVRAINLYTQKHHIPQNLLHAIAITESGFKHKDYKIGVAWPWSINVGGASHFFDTKQEASLFLRKTLNKGIRNIDIGCAQINWLHHGHNFSNPDELLDPVNNIAYASHILLQHYQDAGTWNQAAAHYHSKSPKFAQTYLKKVQNTLSFIQNHRDYQSLIKEQLPQSADIQRNAGTFSRYVDLQQHDNDLYVLKLNQANGEMLRVIPSNNTGENSMIVHTGGKGADVSTMEDSKLVIPRNLHPIQ